MMPTGITQMRTSEPPTFQTVPPSCPNVIQAAQPNSLPLLKTEKTPLPGGVEVADT